MDARQSTRFCSRDRTTERGFALPLAILLAVLYFGLIELLMMDSSLELAEARRFRARIVAQTMAENGAELAARGLVVPETVNGKADEDTPDGTIKAQMTKTPGSNGEPAAFEIVSMAETKGTEKARSRVLLRGRVDGGEIKIDFSMHTQ